MSKDQQKQTSQKQSASTVASKQEQQSNPLPTISLPKGGGAIRGIDEKFSVNPATGTASLAIPVFTSPGRSGFNPQLAVSYDSGAGNSLFGVGWGLAIPGISRKTDKGLPTYNDSSEADTFILSGAEDLVPIVDETGEITPISRDGFNIFRYRPRIEGLFARIEKWTNRESGDIHWRSKTKDNVTSIYGESESCRIAEPDNISRVFSWLIERSYDDKGNLIVYEYKQENDEGVDASLAHEQHRVGKDYANRYLKRVKYCYQNPYYPAEQNSLPENWLMEVVFDYGEHHTNENNIPSYDEVSEWLCRQDAFSSYRAGFDIRTQRLCQRVLMFHHFAEEDCGISPCLVRASEFYYQQSALLSYLVSTTQTGYRWDATNNQYTSKALPPMELTYQPWQLDSSVHSIDQDSLENLPIGVDGAQFQWLDLDGEGISGVLTEQADAWFYKRNLGNGEFAPLEKVADKPNLDLRGGQAQFMDLAGDGHKDVVVLDKPHAGFYERTKQEQWHQWIPFVDAPNINWSDPNLRIVDLTGDGHADVLISEDQVFTWFLSKAEQGFAPAIQLAKHTDEACGPSLVFNDITQSIYLADMSGDGLSDLVRIRNGEVCYWPNLGYARFGAKVTMSNAPWFDLADQFNQRRIRLADIDGTGTTDILYVTHNGITLWSNQSGNSWSAPSRIDALPAIDKTSSINVVDLFGHGTACLVGSSPLPSQQNQPMWYVDLMAAGKPHLLKSVVNNLGGETRLEYTTSSHFYLEDKKAGKPWITKLPFPVHVIKQTELHDFITGTKLVSRYAYHHGYFDGEDREFRGFGMVEQWDTESFHDFERAELFNSAATNVEHAFYIPPVHTKSWFHTGVFKDRQYISSLYAEEYYQRDLDAKLLPDTVLPDDLSPAEQHQACRALKGQILRQELYSDDGSEKAQHPYSVTESNYVIKMLQAKHNNRHGVFFSHASQSIAYHYERSYPPDPRIAHQMVLDVDEYGNALKALAIAYGRRQMLRYLDDEGLPQSIPNPGLQELEADDQAKQTQTLITYSENRVINKPDEDSWYRIGMAAESHSYELTGFTPQQASYFIKEDFIDPQQQSIQLIYDEEIPYEQAATSGRQRRLIEHVRSRYLRNNLREPCDFNSDHEVESLALPFESCKKAFTPGLLDHIYAELDANIIELLQQGKFVFWDGAWWIPSGRVFYTDPDLNDEDSEIASQHFYFPQGAVDPFYDAAHPNRVSRVTFDDYNLLVTQSSDALSNTIQAQNNYITLQPEIVTDPNGNHSQVVFDALGMVVGTAVMGKNGEGDSLAGFNSDLDDSEIDEYFINPLDMGEALLQSASTRLIYDLDRYKKTKDENGLGEPGFVATLSREIHAADLHPGTELPIQYGFTFSNGLGSEVQSKVQAEAGEVDGMSVENRWVGTGWTIFNNKGKPVKQYEPFFSVNHHFEPKIVGVSSTIFYDQLQRAVATLHPNHSYEKVLFDPWQQSSYDVNDTTDPELDDPRNDPDVGQFFDLLAEENYRPSWYQQHINSAQEEKQDAAQKAAKHCNTPSKVYLDNLARSFHSVQHNRAPDEQGNLIDTLFKTWVEFDIEGNQLAIFDWYFKEVPPTANTEYSKRTVMQSRYNMLSQALYQDSMDAGQSWSFGNVVGNPMRSWQLDGDEEADEHPFIVDRFAYDDLHRPTHRYVRQNDSEILAQQQIYGETQANPEENNLRGQLYQQKDGAGILTNHVFDFKGNLLQSSRRLIKNYATNIDWNQAQADDGEYVQTASYDALNRIITSTTPDNSLTQVSYNQANLLERVDVWLRGSVEQFDPINGRRDPADADYNAVKNIDYNVKGQREAIHFGNDVITRYEYDDKTFRLLNINSAKENSVINIQDLFYYYDPVGNISSIRDDAQQTIFFDNGVVEPSAKYEYDAIYQLISATGREHIGQNTVPGPYNGARINPPNPRDYTAMRNYTEHYAYDSVGNIMSVCHIANSQNHANTWKRSYIYDAQANQRASNRLRQTEIINSQNPPSDYHYDVRGNIISMPHLSDMLWDFNDQLRQIQRQVNNNSQAVDRAYYIYDASGQRIRKVVVTTNDDGDITQRKERIYLGGYEIYRKYITTDIEPAFERQCLHVMDDQKRVVLLETKILENKLPVTPDTVQRYQLDNHLGSATVELDFDGEPISYEEYYPYGGTSFAAHYQTVSQKRYRYNGKERDEESGFYYYGARYYIPWLGRWLSCDPVGLKSGTNGYVYVKNSPLVKIDLRGTQESINQLNVYYSEKELEVEQCIPSEHEQGLYYKLPENIHLAEILSLNIEQESSFLEHPFYDNFNVAYEATAQYDWYDPRGWLWGLNADLHFVLGSIGVAGDYVFGTLGSIQHYFDPDFGVTANWMMLSASTPIPLDDIAGYGMVATRSAYFRTFGASSRAVLNRATRMKKYQPRQGRFWSTRRGEIFLERTINRGAIGEASAERLTGLKFREKRFRSATRTTKSGTRKTDFFEEALIEEDIGLIGQVKSGNELRKNDINQIIDTILEARRLTQVHNRQFTPFLVISENTVIPQRLLSYITNRELTIFVQAL